MNRPALHARVASRRGAGDAERRSRPARNANATSAGGGGSGERRS